jgi:cell division protein FtsN
MLSFVKPTATELVNDEATKVVTADEVEEAIIEQAPVVKDSYFLIAGSFKTENQAKRFLSIVHELGEEQAFVLTSPNNRYRVAINGFTSKTEAVSELNTYRQKEDFKTVWVLTQK